MFVLIMNSFFDMLSVQCACVGENNRTDSRIDGGPTCCSSRAPPPLLPQPERERDVARETVGGGGYAYRTVPPLLVAWADQPLLA